jgi:hypothetical protein
MVAVSQRGSKLSFGSIATLILGACLVKPLGEMKTVWTTPVIFLLYETISSSSSLSASSSRSNAVLTASSLGIASLTRNSLAKIILLALACQPRSCTVSFESKSRILQPDERNCFVPTKIGWVEPQAKPHQGIAAPEAVDGFRFAQPILRGHKEAHLTPCPRTASGSPSRS